MIMSQNSGDGRFILRGGLETAPAHQRQGQELRNWRRREQFMRRWEAFSAWYLIEGFKRLESGE